jgi:hypothetical protein
MKYVKNGFVSCWLGSFNDDRALRMYLGEEEAIWEFDLYDKAVVREAQELSPFWNDLGASWINLGLLRESRTLFERQVPSPCAISDLVADFPHASTFARPLAEACGDMGIRQAQTAICIYDFAYRGKGAFAFGKLQFCGAYEYR